MVRSLLWLVMLLFGGGRGDAQDVSSTIAPTPPPQQLGASPDGKFLVLRERAESGERGQVQKNIEICNASGKVLTAWISGLGSTVLLWSPDSHYLAVNDMPGDKGDLLKVFHLDAERQRVIAVREPNGRALLKEQEDRHGNFLASTEAVHLHAEEWKEGRLWCLLSGSAHPKREPKVHVPFHYLWVFRMHEDAPVTMEEEWTRTDPKEWASRDQ